MNPRFYVVTDGSAIGNPGPGGWAAVLKNGRTQWEISGTCGYTTVSEMELTAAVQALRSLPAGASITLCSDSEYLIRGMRYLAVRWSTNGWRNRRGLPLQHRALWQELLQREQEFHIHWKWIRGHNGHALQMRADALAYGQARQNLLLLKRAA